MGSFIRMMELLVIIMIKVTPVDVEKVLGSQKSRYEQLASRPHDGRRTSAQICRWKHNR